VKHATIDDSFEGQLRQASRFIAENHLPEAEAIGASILASYPGRHETHNLLGVLAVAKKRRVDAMKYFEKAVGLSPTNAIYWQNLGKAYLDLDLLEKSLPAFGRALKLNPKLFEALWNAGELFRQIGRAETGLKYLDAALRIDPRHERALLSKGLTLVALGRMAEAAGHYNEMRGSGIETATILVQLAQVKKYSKGDPLFSQIERALEQPQLDDLQRSSLLMALGKIMDDSGDHKSAILKYAEGHQLADRKFDTESYARKIDGLVKTFSPEYFSAHATMGKDDERPVFIVGMPRSGTTLTEQISAGHPMTRGAGELARINKLAERIGFYSGDGELFFKNLGVAKAGDFDHLATAYQGMMDFLAPAAKRVVDKMPHNFQHLGLIATLFPRARIVHCTRNPIDNCVSIYMSSLNEGHSYNSDLKTLGLYYREYDRLMKHWKKVLPLPIFEMNYEETTRDLEGQARRLIDFIGLPWDSACLKFNENKSTVQTLSNWQVRQPIYTTSVERWRRYEKHLGPLIEALGDLVDVKPAPA
jgi:tetratricopeptide (TPR) repeat protein